MLVNGSRRRLTNVLAGIAVSGVVAAWATVTYDLLREPSVRDECGFNDPTNLALRFWSESQYWYTVKQWFIGLAIRDNATSERWARASTYLDQTQPGVAQRTMSDRDAVALLQGGAGGAVRAVNRRMPVAADCEAVALHRSRELPSSGVSPMPGAIGLRLPDQNGPNRQRR